MNQNLFFTACLVWTFPAVSKGFDGIKHHNYTINSHKHGIHIHDDPNQGPAAEGSYQLIGRQSALLPFGATKKRICFAGMVTHVDRGLMGPVGGEGRGGISTQGWVNKSPKQLVALTRQCQACVWDVFFCILWNFNNSSTAQPVL